VVVWAAGVIVSTGRDAAGEEGEEEEGAMISRKSSSIAISSTTDETETLSTDNVELSSEETWVVASPPAAGTSG